MQHPLVSIIVPCYKQAEYLPETLDSVLAQTYPNWECVIVNDGSPDNTEEIAKIYLEKDGRFKYLSQENYGLATARNVGIGHSKGDLILPLDADDLIAHSYIEKAINHFINYPETKLVYCKAETFGGESRYWDLPPFNYDEFIWNNCIFCTAMYRRSDYDKTCGYNANMVHGNEDWDFWLSLLKKDDVVYRIDEVLFYYRIKEISMRTNLANHYLEKNLIQLCNNHPEIYDSFKNRVILYHKELEDFSALKKELYRIQNTHAYRLGKFLLNPFSFLKKQHNDFHNHL